MLDLNALALPDLFQELTADGSLERLLDAAFAEDARPPGDITSASVIEPGRIAQASIVARRDGVAAGMATLPALVRRAPGVRCQALANDGDSIDSGTTLALLRGNLRSILLLERTLLNLLGRLSGVASLTRQYVRAVAGTSAMICDTRKTTPGLRSLEKYSVRCGGGTLHRIGLYDAVLYKDNHLAGIALHDLAAALTRAIRAVRAQHQVRFVEVEVDALAQLRQVLNIESGLIDMVLLDNMDDGQLKEAVELRNATAPRILLECSGGVALERVAAIAASGVDRISVGALTHSANWLDIGLDIGA